MICFGNKTSTKTGCIDPGGLDWRLLRVVLDDWSRNVALVSMEKSIGCFMCIPRPDKSTGRESRQPAVQYFIFLLYPQISI